jgi:hypothetical protein
MSGQLKGRRAAFRLLAAAAVVAVVTFGTAAWRWTHAPRAWKPEEVPVAFWAWRAETPSEAEVGRAARETGARVLFLRAGQFDLSGGRVGRVRAVEGRMPRGVELHLVYNATPALLAEFEKVDEKVLAACVVETFKADAARAGRDGARVVGLQLDVDVPTRLLSRYGRMLRAARASLPEGAQLSVTGLPTWMSAPALREVLDAVDFWVPQFYGAEIPATAESVVPVASPRGVARAVERARELGKPFYAGLAAYGYALLYSEKGRLLELRGDIDPARVAADRNFELVERRAFEPRVMADGAASGGPLASEWRYVFRARGDTVIEDLVVRTGEQIVLDVPSSEHLRASARGVRTGAGEKLLGICLFRLPTRGDPTTLSLAQMASALRDREAQASTRVSVESARGVDGVEKLPGQLLLTATNEGEAGALFGDGALAVTLRIRRGSVRGVTTLEGFDSFETLCEAFGDAPPPNAPAGHAAAAMQPCSAARANVLRLGARSWASGARARVGLSLDGDAPAQMSVAVAVRADDGRVWEDEQSLSLRGENGR